MTEAIVTEESTEDLLAVAGDLWRHSGLPGSLRGVSALSGLPKRVHSKTCVLRLESAGRHKTAVVAKRTWRSAVELEWLVYREVLEPLALASPRAIALLPDEHPGRAWLLMEEANGRPFDSKDRAQRRATGSWLASLHSATASPDFALQLPAGDPARAFQDLLRTQRCLHSWLEDRSLGPSQDHLLDAVVTLLDVTERSWPDIEELCLRLPSAVVHGDFCGKNVKVGYPRAGRTVAVFDWEMAGWGVAASDLHSVDVAAWASRMRTEGTVPTMSIEDVQYLASILWALHCLAWEVDRFTPLGAPRAIRNIGLYLESLRGAETELGWA